MRPDQGSCNSMMSNCPASELRMECVMLLERFTLFWKKRIGRLQVSTLLRCGGGDCDGGGENKKGGGERTGYASHVSAIEGMEGSKGSESGH
jgi:hypothetical protein